ncbi:hypothetical protein [Paraburkholderia kururiensis]|uniref:hypothetical protein n=1 Tax=Paraburkholderia kururiensis TaxID=984307 RepID=UPI0012E090D4|nr:hypothetical protein [Paraburkholderia kururiensis]
MDELIKELREALYGPAQWGDTVLMSRAIDSLTSQQSRIAELEDEVKALRTAEHVGILTIRRFRGSDSMVNTDFDYYGNLPDGSYQCYVAPPAEPVLLTDGTASNSYATAEREHLGDPDKRTGIYARRPTRYEYRDTGPLETGDAQ